VESGKILKVEELGNINKPLDLGVSVANKLLSLGAGELLNEK